MKNLNKEIYINNESSENYLTECEKVDYNQ